MKKSALFVFIASAILILGCGKTDPRPQRVIIREEKLQKETELVRKRAEKGDSDAMYELGKKYRIGWGVPEDKPTAVKWLKKSADLGNYAAISVLAECYEKGEGIAQNKKEADRLNKIFNTYMTKRAEGGDSDAMYALGCAYTGGHGVTKDKAEGKKWMEKAVESGNLIALEYLLRHSLTYDKVGHRMVCNADTVKCLTKLIEFGKTEPGYSSDEKGSVLVELGDCYRDGCGVGKNTEEASRLYKMAVEKGSERGKLRLSEMSGSIK